VPAIMRWPGKIEPGQKVKQLIGMPDIYRTFVNIGGAEEPDHKLDGHDLTPFLTGQVDQAPREQYYYIRGGIEAVRDGKWKLRTAGGEPQLFNMVNDPYERFNRAENKPEIVDRLRAEMEEMASEMETHVSD